MYPLPFSSSCLPSPQRYAHVDDYAADLKLLVKNAETYNSHNQAVLAVVAQLDKAVDAALDKLRRGPSSVFPFYLKEVVDATFSDRLIEIHVSLASLEVRLACRMHLTRALAHWYSPSLGPIDNLTITYCDVLC